jgi:hypothetical protein
MAGPSRTGGSELGVQIPPAALKTSNDVQFKAIMEPATTAIANRAGTASETHQLNIETARPELRILWAALNAMLGGSVAVAALMYLKIGK